MGINRMMRDALDARNRRLADPDVQRRLNAQHLKTKESFRRLGEQTLETGTGIIYNALFRPFLMTKSKDPKQPGSYSPETQIMISSAVIPALALKLVGRVLMTAGRTGHYGVRRLAAI